MKVLFLFVSLLLLALLSYGQNDSIRQEMRLKNFINNEIYEHSLDTLAVHTNNTYYENGRKHVAYSLAIKRKLWAEQDSSMMANIATCFSRYVLNEDTTAVNMIYTSIQVGKHVVVRDTFSQVQLLKIMWNNGEVPLSLRYKFGDLLICSEFPANIGGPDYDVWKSKDCDSCIIFRATIRFDRPALRWEQKRAYQTALDVIRKQRHEKLKLEWKLQHIERTKMNKSRIEFVAWMVLLPYQHG